MVPKVDSKIVACSFHRMTSQDKNEPDKRANRDWTEDQEAILASLTREESGDGGNGPTTDDEQVTFSPTSQTGTNFYVCLIDGAARIFPTFYVPTGN